MATIKRFEDLSVWKLAFDNANLIYELTSKPAFNRDFALRDQIRRAAISVFSNIAEGFERDGNREFVNFLSVAKGSCGEVRAQAMLANRLGYITNDELTFLAERLVQTSHQISGFQKYLRDSQLRGRKFA